MNRLIIIFAIAFFSFAQQSKAQLKAPGVKWDENYSFDQSNEFKIEFYAKNNELMRTRKMKTFYQANCENFLVQMLSEMKGNGLETIIDKKNEVAVQLIGTGGGATPNYNTGGYKMPVGEDLKKLELAATSETKDILGYLCKKYTYTHKKIFGEVWITDKIALPNDCGVFRAAKMAALHNTLSVEGFVMEMTTEDAKGGKTLMTTTSVKNSEKYTVNLAGVSMSTALNKVNYFSF